MQNPIGNTNGKGGVSGATNPQLNPREFMWSATAVSFGALMAVLESYTKMRQDQMLISNDVSTEISNATIAMGTAQLESFQAQAEQTRQSSYMQIASAAGAGLGVVASGVGMGLAYSASAQIKPMDTIVSEMNAGTTMNPQVVAGNNLNPFVTPADDPTLTSLQTKLTNGGFTAKDLTTPDANGNTGLNKVLGQDANGHDITLQNVIETTNDSTQFQAAQKAVATIRDNAHSTYQSQQNFASTVSTTFNGLGTASSNTAQSVFSARQADAQIAQGEDQQAQTFATAEQQFSQTTYGNMRQSASYADQGVSNTFSFINQMINNEMRG